MFAPGSPGARSLVSVEGLEPPTSAMYERTGGSASVLVSRRTPLLTCGLVVPFRTGVPPSNGLRHPSRVLDVSWSGARRVPRRARTVDPSSRSSSAIALLVSQQPLELGQRVEVEVVERDAVLMSGSEFTAGEH